MAAEGEKGSFPHLPLLNLPHLANGISRRLVKARSRLPIPALTVKMKGVRTERNHNQCHAPICWGRKQLATALALDSSHGRLPKVGPPVTNSVVDAAPRYCREVDKVFA